MYDTTGWYEKTLKALEEYSKAMQKDRAEKYLIELLETAPNPETKEAIVALLQSPHIVEDAKLFFDFDDSYINNNKLYSSSKHIGKSYFYDMYYKAYHIKNYNYYEDYKLVGESKPAKPEPDWKHPIPVSVKNDGPSKQQRAKLRKKRK